MEFISLKLEVISLEGISWVINSLRNDEMMPSEKAIVCRIKEAFAHKISPQTWDEIFDVIKT